MLKKSGIYVISNSVNGRCYYGSAACFGTRFSIHRYYLRKGTSPSLKLQYAWNKYGEAAFKFSILMVCSKENLLMYEQRFLDATDAVTAGYNICAKAGSALGVKRRPESIAKTIAAHKARVRSEDELNRLRTMNIGRKPAPETIAKIVAKTRGQKRDKEFCRKLGERSKGKVYSAETKDKQRQAALNRNSSRGQNNVNAKMTPDKVILIRAKHKAGMQFTVIGSEFGLHPSTVADIARHKTWRHV